MVNYFDFGNENWLALIVAIVANFVIGFVYYAAWFPTGKMWMKYQGIDPATAKPNKNDMMRGLLMMLVGAFLMMLVLGHFINKDTAGFAKLIGDQMNYAFSMAVLFWMGFQVPMLIGSVAWEKKPAGMAVINAGYQLISMLVAAMIFVYMT